ncbi:DUF4145 domain-containing protein [Streptomyces sp. NPDC003660]
MSTRSHVSIEDLDSRVPAGECPNCKLNVAFNHLSRREVWPKLIDNPVGPGRSGADFSGGGAAFVTPPAEPYVWRVMEHVLSCQRCHKTSVLHEHWGPDLPKGDDHKAFVAALESKKSKVRFVALVHPRHSANLLHEAAPDAVRDLFSEGTRCEEAGALRAAAAMYRAAVEEICKDRGATGGNLKAKIADLVSRGVSAEVVRDLDEARTLGNWSLHDGLSFSREEVGDVASLIEEAVFLVYVQPEQRAALREARKQRRDQFRATT